MRSNGRRMLPRLRSSLLLGAALGLCCTAPPDGPVPPDAPARPRAHTVRGLPAYALPGERFGGEKADESDEYRLAHPELFAITVPPEGRVFRPMVEWEPMKALLLTFDGWPAGDGEVRKSYLGIIGAVAPVAEVWVVVDEGARKDQLLGFLAQAGIGAENVKFFVLPTDSVWHIDYGPMSIVDEATSTYAFVDWKYYHGRPRDDAIPTRLGQMLGVTVYREQASHEGGNFQADGKGRCFTSQRGLQYSGLDLTAFQLAHQSYLGCQDMVFLKDIHNDGTGHIDMFFKLVSTDRAVLGEYPDALFDPVAKKAMDDNAGILEALAARGDGPAMTVLRLPMPGYGIDPGDGTKPPVKIPFTYLNSTLVNGVNVWPVFERPEWDASRAEAQAVFEEAMPGWSHVGVPSDRLSMSSGAIHCITRTIPAMEDVRWIPDGTCDAGSCRPPDGFDGVAKTGPCSDGTLCFGPAWLCPCNDCAAGCAQGAAACLGMDETGCCDAGDTLHWCEAGAHKTQACAAGTCGWDAEKAYHDCGTTGGPGPDPAHPRECPACIPNCGGRVCGPDGCSGACGACPTGETCSPHGLCAPSTPACQDACVPIGATGVDEHGEPWECAPDPATGCNTQAPPGSLAAAAERDDGGCTAGRRRPPVAALLLLVLASAFALLRRPRLHA